MLAKELRQPWSIAALAIVILLASVLLYDRWRTPPYEWPVHPDGIPRNLVALEEKRNVTFEWEPQDALSRLASALLRLPEPLLERLPGGSLCDEPDCESPLQLTPENIEAIQQFCAINRYVLDQAYAAAAAMPPVSQQSNGMTLSPQDYDHYLESDPLRQAFHLDMMRCTLAQDNDGALRSVEAMGSVADLYADSANLLEQSCRVILMHRICNSIEVLVNRLELQPREWERLIALASAPLDDLQRDFRAAFEYEAMEAMRNGIPTLLALWRDDLHGQLHPYTVSLFPFSTGELSAEALFSLAGFGRYDRTLLVRLAQSNRQEFDLLGGVVNDDWDIKILTPGLMKLRTFYFSSRDLARIAVFPSLLRAAAALDCHRNTHGAFPESLAAVDASCVSDPTIAFKDPLGKGDLGYRKTENGVVVYSVGQNRLDEYEQYEAFRKTQRSNGDMGNIDDIRFELRSVRGEQPAP